MSDDGSTKATKRRKTARACDYCRDHKLKCDFSSDKPGSSSLKCKHCKDFGIECIVSARIAPLRTAASSTASSSAKTNSDQRFRPMRVVAQTEPRYAGPTSLSQMVSAVTKRWPTRASQMFSQMDLKFGHARVDGVSGGPFLMLPQARYPANQPDSDDLERAKIDAATKRFLLGKYQKVQARVFPILSDKESTDAVELGQEEQLIATLSNVGLALLTIAAMIRDTPVQIRTALLYHLRRRRHVDVSSSLETVQYLLLLCANVEILSPDTNISTGMSLNLTGLLVRMAQDLGLHRDISPLKVSKEHLNRRARIWAACIIADRWYSISYGQPCLIRLEDCDAPPPSPYLDSYDGVGLAPASRPYEVHVEHVRLCDLIYRLLRLVFTPSGMRNSTLQEMEALKADLDAWDATLPANLRLSRQQDRRSSVIGAGLLHILKVTVDFIFYRAALVSPYNTSKSATMNTSAVWESLVKRSAEAIDWISTTDEGYDVLFAWSICMYGAVQLCLISFYDAVNGGDPEPLRQARRCLQSWGSSSVEDPLYDVPKPKREGEPSTSLAGANGTGSTSLTLRIKTYTLVAMLAGIAEAHIANQLPQPDLNGTVLDQKGALASSQKGEGQAASTSSPLSPYSFNAVLNPGSASTSSMAGPHPAVAPLHNGSMAAAATGYPPIQAATAPVYPANTHHLFTSSGVPHPPRDPLSGSVAQVDLLTLQHWADEIMRSTPNLDVLSYSQQLPPPMTQPKQAPPFQ